MKGQKVAVSCFDWLHGPVNSVQLPESKPTDRGVEKMIFWKEIVICSVLLCSLLVMGKRNKHNFLLAYDSLQVTFLVGQQKQFRTENAVCQQI